MSRWRWPSLPFELCLLAGLTAALAVVHLYAATVVGFGDSEALYACYALHPQPAYLDHPGFVGVLSRTVGGGTAPSSFATHVFTTLVSALVPWLAALVCRACGATPRASLAAASVFALVPEIAIGLFALTPDLPLAVSWLGALACAAAALRSPAGSTRATVAFAGAGVLTGIAIASKASGVLLLAALLVAYAAPPARAHARTVSPWLGLAPALIVGFPVLRFERHAGWPMLMHRLVDTQLGAGLSARNLGALVGGQIAYVSPGVLVLAFVAAQLAWRKRRGDAVSALLFFAFAVPACVLVLVISWSRVAEPHWLAPALLALVPVLAREPSAVSRRAVIASTAIAGAMVAIVHVWVLVPSAPRLAPASYDPRLDLSNELYGWPEVVQAVRETIDAAPSGPEDVTVVGPHWILCAQLEAALRDTIPVGCDTSIPDDFDGWHPRALWRRSRVIVWVTDARIGPPPYLPAYAPVSERRVEITRGGRVVRRFSITTFARRALA